MKGDFSSFTFDRRKHYSRVLMQQGRMQLDSDWNEQGAILLHRLETMARDLIGPFGGPSDDCGFAISPGDPGDFNISRGRYYVDGILCENDANSSYRSQPFQAPKIESGAFVVYLDIWEQFVNGIEDPGMLEVALGGHDTSARARVVWCVRTFPVSGIPGLAPNCRDLTEKWGYIVRGLQPPNRGWLSVRTEETGREEAEPAATRLDSRYRGAANQLYRIEIHAGGRGMPAGAARKAREIDANCATFKWSRENGSEVFPVLSAGDGFAILDRFGGHLKFGIDVGDWVEAIDDSYTLQNRSDGLFRVSSIDPVRMEARLEPGRPLFPGGFDRKRRPYLRRWHQKEGARNTNGLVLKDGAAVVFEGVWMPLEDGLQIRFEPPPKTNETTGPESNTYRSRDYWWVPVRTARNGRITWPAAQNPHGVSHHFAPLGIGVFGANGVFEMKADCSKRFDSASHFG